MLQSITKSAINIDIHSFTSNLTAICEPIV
jgi:hypothetical protein